MRDGKDTFSRAAKEELARVVVKGRAPAYWETLALRRYLAPRAIKAAEASVPAEPFLMRRLFYLVKQGGGETSLYSAKNRSGNKKTASGRSTRRLRSKIRTVPDGYRPSFDILVSNVACRRAFLRGAFLARGSVSSPVRNHHLEIAMPTSVDGALVRSLMDIEELKGGLIRRRSSHVAYLKDADEIAEFLRIIGASQAVLDYEDVRARKSLKSSVQRLVNMDRANVSRSVEASLRQVEDIQTIDDVMGLNRLPAALKELARLRLVNRDLSMEELGELLAPPSSKSAVNHRFRRIADIAADLRQSVRQGQKGGGQKPPAR